MIQNCKKKEREGFVLSYKLTDFQCKYQVL